MDLIFYHIYRWVDGHKGVSLSVALLVLLGCGFLASRIQFKEDITQVIPQNEQTDLTSKAIQQVNFADKITVLIRKQDSGSLDDATILAQEFIDILAPDSAYVKSIEGQVSSSTIADTYDFVYHNLPFFLDSADYDVIARKLSPDSIAQQAARNYRSLSTASSFVSAEFIQKDPLGIAFLGLEKLQRLHFSDNYMLYNGLLATKDSSHILLFINPTYQGTETAHNEAFVDHLYQVQDSLNQRYADRAQVSSFGSALVAVANATQIKHDILTTVLISMTVLMLLLVFFYKRLIVPLLVFIPTLFAVFFALAILYLYKPVISAISISIGAVLIGITIDYSLHVLTHFRQNKDVKTLYKEMTRPILMSGATTAIAFLCLLFVHSEVLIDLGIFAFLTVFFSAIFTLILIPHLYKPKENLGFNSVLDKVAKFPFERSKILIGACLLLLFISLYTSFKVSFNNDLSNLNFIPDDLQQVEQQLESLTDAQAKSLYVIATGDSYEKVLANNQVASTLLRDAKSADMIIDYTGIHELLKSEKQQQSDIARWQTFWKPDIQQAVRQNLIHETASYGFQPEAHQDFFDLLKQDFETVSLVDYQRVAAWGVSEMLSERNGFYTVTTIVKVEEEKRNEILDIFSKEKDILIIDRKQLNETYLGKLRDDFNNLVSYSFIAVLAILWLFFRRIELVLLSAIPIGLTGLVTAGLMGLFGLQFNIFSAIVCTLIFGHGVDFSIFMTTALQKQYITGKDELNTYRTSILLAVLTTVLAIGALVFAKHPALLSISTVSLIGVFAAVLITFVFYPILFRFFISGRAKRGKSPFTLSILFFSILLFTYYGLGCVLISFYGRVLLRLYPLKAAQQELMFRNAMSSFMKSVLYYHPFIRNKTLNPYNENFEKPSVIIANHSSFLDTLSIGLLFPKVIFLVNDWVWNSPIFGKAVRALGFYPVNNGLESGLEMMREKVNQGYHLVVFPEGTRSYDNTIKRFHKGAFYLAEKLNVDILPVYLHGNGDCLPKGDFMIYPGAATVVIGNRIRPDYTAGYALQTKQIMSAYRKSFFYWRSRLEDENYFIKKLNLAYRYKDEEIVSSVYQALESQKGNLYALHSYFKEDETFSHWADNHGEFDFLLSLQSGRRKIYSYIENEHKRQVAQSIYYVQLRKIYFTDKLAQHKVLLLSKCLSIDEKNLLNSSGFQTIVNIAPQNKLDFLIQNGYTYVKMEGTMERFELHGK